MVFSAGMVFANTEVLEAIRGNVTIRLDGNNLVLAPEDRPVIIDGRTFLPVRALADNVGLDVDWDAATSTVILQSRSGATPPTQTEPPVTEPPVTQARALLAVFPDPVRSGSGVSTAVNANLRGGQNATTNDRLFPNSWIMATTATSPELTFALNGEFNLLTGYVGAVRNYGRDGETVTGVVRFFGDGTLLGEHTFRYADVAVPFSVDVTGVTPFGYHHQQRRPVGQRRRRGDC